MNIEQGEKLTDYEPILRMPFPAGTVVICKQGNCTSGRSHKIRENGNCTYALDLANSLVEDLTVVSAASGQVVQTYTAGVPDRKSGYGFGNFVKIVHGYDYFTFYAHLEKVLINAGDHVESGTPIGIVGETGWAGSKHLHFSLHKGELLITGGVIAPSVPMHAIITNDLSGNRLFQRIGSLEFVGGSSSEKGHLYGSENARDKPIVLGEAAEDLNRTLRQGYDALLDRINR